MNNSPNFDSDIIAALRENDFSTLSESLDKIEAAQLNINELMSSNYLQVARDNNCDDAIFELLLGASVDQEAKLISPNPVLFQAALDYDQELIDVFLDAGAHVNIKGFIEIDSNLEGHPPTARRQLEVPLICAMISRYRYEGSNQDIADALLRTPGNPGVDLTLTDENGNNAFSYAAAFGTVDLLDRLRAIDPQGFADYSNKNLCQIAVYNENKATLDYLLRNKLADPNEVSALSGRDTLEVFYEAHNNWAVDVDKWEADRADDSSESKILKGLYASLVQYGAKSSARHAKLFDKAMQLRNAFIIPDKTQGYEDLY